MSFPINSTFIDRASHKLGIWLPSSYTAHMQQSNGGEIDAADDTWQFFPIFDDSDKARIKRTCNEIVRETVLARDWPAFQPRPLRSHRMAVAICWSFFRVSRANN